MKKTLEVLTNVCENLREVSASLNTRLSAMEKQHTPAPSVLAEADGQLLTAADLVAVLSAAEAQ